MQSRDPWLLEFEDAKACANEVFLLCQDRDGDAAEGQAAAARQTASARRKWNGLCVRLDRLDATLTSGSV